MTQDPEPAVGYQPAAPTPPPSSLDLPPLPQPAAPQPPAPGPTPGYAPPPPAQATPSYGQSQYSPYSTPSYGQAYHPNPAAYPVPTAGYTPMPPLGAADPDVTQNKVLALLSYIGPLVLIPILSGKKSGFARFHANQGLVLFIGEVIVGFLIVIFTGFLASALWWLLGLGFLVLSVLGVINVVNGHRNQLPVVGKIKIL